MSLLINSDGHIYDSKGHHISDNEVDALISSWKGKIANAQKVLDIAEGLRNKPAETEPTEDVAPSAPAAPAEPTPAPESPAPIEQPAPIFTPTEPAAPQPVEAQPAAPTTLG